MLRKIILSPYYLVLKIRHALYDSGVWKVHRSDVPTICVGNIAIGGSGKTPHTEMIVRTLLDSEEWGERNIAVLSRGHKRKSSGFQQVTTGGNVYFYGDEPLQIKNKYPQITVAVDRSRIEGCDFLAHPEKLQSERAARKCKEKELPPSDIIILDDAFQYRDLKADVNIILLNYYRPVNKDFLLPFGNLRDIPERLRDADIIIVTKCPAYMEDYEKIEWLRCLGVQDYDPQTCRGTRKKNKEVTILFTRIDYCPLEPVFKFDGDNRYIYSKKLILFSGIANDMPLRRYLSDKYQVVKRFNFSDHHNYHRLDIERIASAAENNPTAVVLTTEKDSQRVVNYKKVPEMLKERMFQVPVEVSFLSDNEREVFKTTLMSYLKGPRSER